MKKIIRTIIVLMMLPFINDVYAYSLCTPSKDYVNYINSGDDLDLPVFCSEILDSNYKINNSFDVYTSVDGDIYLSGSSDSYYNSNDLGYITDVKDQADSGMCWAFSANSVVETNAIKNNVGTYDLSEAHVAYSILGGLYSDTLGQRGKYNGDHLDGGNVTYPASYYFGGYGMLDDTETVKIDFNHGDLPLITSDDYIKGDNFISVADYKVKLSSYSACSTNNIAYIKSKIVDEGSVQAGIYYTSSDLVNNKYYITLAGESTGTNHAITIVGWDDSIPASSFGKRFGKNKTNKNGAWIVKNSWGTDWGEDGYFYISYADYFVCSNVASFSNVSNKTFENTYKTAELVGLPTIMFDNTFYVASNFKNLDRNSVIDRITFAVAEDSSYTLYMTDVDDFDQGNWNIIASGESTELGITSVDLDSLDITNDFMLVLKTTPKGSTTSLFTLCDDYDSSVDDDDITYVAGMNYIAESDLNWEDLYNFEITDSSTNTNITLNCKNNFYVYTNKKVIPPAPEISSNNTSFININDNILNINLGYGTTFNYESLISNTTINSENISLTYKGTELTSTSAVPTGSVLELDNNTYTIIILGDVYTDGKINSKDYARVMNHIMDISKITDENEKKAADIYADNKISSKDYAKILNLIMGG